MNDIEMIKYTISIFDFEKMKSNNSTVIEIKKDGSVAIKRYVSGSQKIISKKRMKISLESFLNLCHLLEVCIKNADSEIHYVDDCNAELVIFHRFNRVESMSRGLGNDVVRIYDVLNNFIKDNKIEI